MVIEMEDIRQRILDLIPELDEEGARFRYLCHHLVKDHHDTSILYHLNLMTNEGILCITHDDVRGLVFYCKKS